MRKTTVFGRWESISLLLVFICIQLYINMPRIVAEKAGTAGWILAFYVSVLALGLFMIISVLYRKYEGMDILDVTQKVFGNTIKVITGLTFMIYFLIITALVLRQCSENIKIVSLSLSPISFVMFFLAGCMAAGAYLGIEAIARVAAIGVPIIIAAYVSTLVGVTEYVDVSQITPILGEGPHAILIGGLTNISIYTGLVLILFLPPFLKTNKNLRAAGYTALILSTAFFTMGSLVYLLVYAYPTAIENFLPIYQLARLINYGRFFQRIESVFLISWGLSAFLYLSLGLFLTTYVFQKCFGLKYYRPLVLPLTILIFTLGMVPYNHVSTIKIDTEYFGPYAWMVLFGISLLVLTVGNIKKGNRKKGG